MGNATWFRRLTPSSLIFALLCFCLPWIEIKCNDPNQGLIVVTQSGLQMTYGGTSTTVNGKPISDARRQQAGREVGAREKPALLMIGYAACLLSALVAALTIRDAARRWLVCLAASAGACVLIVIQVATGFPLVEGVPKGEGGWSYTAWFWAALAMTFAALASAVAEKVVVAAPLTESAAAKSEGIRPAL
jgi:hypothetical protein